MIFCVGEGSGTSSGAGYHQKNMIFNQQVTESEFNECRKVLNDIKIFPTKWIDKKDMTKQEKDDVSGWSEMGGYLKRFDYKEYWANFWNDASRKEKDLILNIEQFDAEIFEKITGIKIEKENSHKTELLKKAEELIDKAKELQAEANKL